MSLTAAEIAAAVRARKLSARDVTEAALARIAAHDPKLNAFTAVTAEWARAKAAAIDAQLASGGDPGPLAGVPFAVKNLFDIAGIPTLAGSSINRSHPPAAADATLISRLEAQGAVLVGALNMGEYAYDFTGENSHYGASRNPHDLSRMSGGSSGGSGTAAAAGMVPITLGSDTNGSIRVPSSLCGLFGLKPTYGRLSRAGTFPFVGSLDHLGPMARSTADLALAYDAMRGSDSRDPACADVPAMPLLPELQKGIEGLRIARAGGYFQQPAHPEAHAAVDAVANALGVTEKVDVPGAAEARAAAYLITMSEGAALHLNRLRTDHHHFDPDVRDRLIAGAMIPGAWVTRAQTYRRQFQARMAALFGEVDVLLAPATPCPAPLIGQKRLTLGGRDLPLRPNLGLFTQPISFVGLPVVSVPVWLPDAKLPIGVQIICAAWREDIAMRISAWLEGRGLVRAPVGGTA
jgi:AtzE family amidohydrolase